MTECYGNMNHIFWLFIKLGILDAAVMGGIMNYEKSFFIPEYLEHHPDDEHSIKKLKDLIADQIPLLEIGVQLHKERTPGSLIPFQQRLEDCFAEMQASVVEKYGKRVSFIHFYRTDNNNNNSNKPPRTTIFRGEAEK